MDKNSAPKLSGRVLVAEDNLINQKILSKQIERLGLQVDVVSNGREALKALETKNYNVILMDCQMPEMDGYAATIEIRKSTGAIDHLVPIVAVTANDEQSDRQHCLDIGMNSYVSKPIDNHKLFEILAPYTQSGEPK